MPVLNVRYIGRAAAAVTLALVGSSHAHITLEQPSAAAGTTYKAVFRVGHGCAGSATRAVVVHLPQGVSHAQPMPKAGWTLDLQPASGEPTQIAWRGGPLPSTHYDEFVLVATAPEQAGTVYWPVRQVCAEGRNDWVEVPRAGQKLSDLKSPAAALEILPSGGAAAHNH